MFRTCITLIGILSVSLLANAQTYAPVFDLEGLRDAATGNIVISFRADALGSGDLDGSTFSLYRRPTAIDFDHRDLFGGWQKIPWPTRASDVQLLDPGSANENPRLPAEIQLTLPGNTINDGDVIAVAMTGNVDQSEKYGSSNVEHEVFESTFSMTPFPTAPWTRFDTNGMVPITLTQASTGIGSDTQFLWLDLPFYRWTINGLNTTPYQGSLADSDLRSHHGILDPWVNQPWFLLASSAIGDPGHRRASISFDDPKDFQLCVTQDISDIRGTKVYQVTGFVRASSPSNDGTLLQGN